VWAHASLQGVLIMEHSPGTPDHIL
jgi:hypothetical protein